MTINNLSSPKVVFFNQETGEEIMELNPVNVESNYEMEQPESEYKGIVHGFLNGEGATYTLTNVEVNLKSMAEMFDVAENPRVEELTKLLNRAKRKRVKQKLRKKLFKETVFAFIDNEMERFKC